jgi:hypothetical protein
MALSPSVSSEKIRATAPDQLNACEVRNDVDACSRERTR